MNNTTFLFILSCGILCFLVLPQIFEREDRTPKEPPKPETVKFIGGELDGKQIPVPKRQPWYAIPTLPKDPNDWEEMEHQIEGMRMIKPLWTFYQQIEDENYFFVRNLSEAEVEESQRTGEAPSAKPKE